MFVVLGLFNLFVVAGKPMKAVPVLFLAAVLLAGIFGELVAQGYSEPMNRWLRKRWGVESKNIALIRSHMCSCQKSHPTQICVTRLSYRLGPNRAQMTILARHRMLFGSSTINFRIADQPPGTRKERLRLAERMVRCRQFRHGSRRQVSMPPMDIAKESCYLLCNVQRRDHER